jgi:hypothetical protein
MLFAVGIGIALAIAVASESTHIPILNGILAIIAILAAFAAFLTKNYVYLLNPVLKRKKNERLVVYGEEAFALAPTGTSIVRREGENVYASSFVRIPMYRSGTEMDKDEKEELSKLFGRILTLGKIPIKLSAEMYAVNKDEYIARIRDMLNRAEERYRSLQNIGGGQQRAVLERARGEVTMWRNLLDNVSRSRSQALLLYAMVSALGGSEEEASNIAYQRAQELAGGISATLGVSATVITGDDILPLVEPEYMIPVETVSERIRQRSMGRE